MKDQVFIKTDKSESRKKIWYIIGGVFLIIFFIFLGFLYMYYWCPIFRVSDFSILGADDAPRARTAILDYYNTERGFFSPAVDRIAFWLSRDGEIKAPQFLPYASSIRLISDFPTKKVVVEVTPRTMKGIWCSNSECYAFDENGIIFANAPDVSGSIILKIRDENNMPITFGSTVLTPEEFRVMTSAIESVKASNIPVYEIVIQDRGLREWKTVAPNGFVVKFSFNTIPEDLESVFRGVLERTQIDKLTYIDLRVQNRVYFK